MAKKKINHFRRTGRIKKKIFRSKFTIKKSRPRTVKLAKVIKK